MQMEQQSLLAIVYLSAEDALARSGWTSECFEVNRPTTRARPKTAVVGSW